MLAAAFVLFVNLFPPQNQLHTHGSNIALVDNNLIATWFQGDGEADGTHVNIMMAYSSTASPDTWSAPFLVAKSGEKLPDTNPSLFINANHTAGAINNQVQLYWEKVNHQSWQGAQPRMNTASLPKGTINSKDDFVWSEELQGKPIDFSQTYPTDFTDKMREQFLNTWPLKDGKFNPTSYSTTLSPSGTWPKVYLELKDYLAKKVTANKTPEIKKQLQSMRKCTAKEAEQKFKEYARLPDSANAANFDLFSALTLLYNIYDAYVVADLSATTLNKNSPYYGLGWETRANPLTITTGNIQRTLLPLYSDALNISLIVYSDNQGKTWKVSSTPIMSRSGIQPSLVQVTTPNGAPRVLAFMRNNAGILNLDKALYSYSDDAGVTWSNAIPSEIYNHSASLATIVLSYGDYKGAIVILYNADEQRKVLNAAISQDQGKTWKKTTLLQSPDGSKESFSYPSLVQAPDGKIYVTFTHYFNDDQCSGQSPKQHCQNIGALSFMPKELLASP